MPPDIGAIARETRWLYRLAKTLVKDDATADDIVQETMLRAAKSPPATESSTRGWLATVARRVLFADRRAQSRREEREAHIARPEADDRSADLLERTEAQRRLLEVVSRLEPGARQVVLLRFFDDMPIKDIADRIGESADTVKTRLRRTLLFLREKLAAEYGSEGSWRSALLPLAACAAHTGGPSLAAKKTAAAQIVAGAFLMSQAAKWIVALTVLFAAIGSVALLYPSSPNLRDAPLNIEFTRGEVASHPQSDANEIDRAQTNEAHAGNTTAGDASHRPPLSNSPTKSNEPRRDPTDDSHKSGRIDGRVVGGLGLPVAEATVLCGSGPQTRGLENVPDAVRRYVIGEIQHTPGFATATTDAEGNFRFEGLPMGRPYALFAIAPDYGVQVKKDVYPHREAGDIRVTMTLLAGSRVRVKVRDENGRTIPRARIQLVATFAQITTTIDKTTRSDGELLTPAIPLHSLNVSVTKDGYISPPPISFDDIVAGREILAEFVLRRGSMIPMMGRLASKNLPLSKFREIYGDERTRERIKVVVYDKDPGQDPRPGDGDPARIDFQNGFWSIDYDSEKRPWVVVFFDERPIGSAVVRDPKGSTDIAVNEGFLPLPVETGTIEITATAKHTGRIGDWADVTLKGADPHNRSIERRGRLTDTESLLQFRKVVYGRYVVYVRSPGCATAAQIIDHSDAGVARPGHLTRSRIELAKATAVIRGKLRRNDGEVFAQASLTLLSGSGLPIRGERSPIDRQRSTTDADGEFQFGNLELGRYQILVEPEPGSLFVMMALAEENGGQSVDFAAPKLSRVDFRPSFTGRDAFVRIASSSGIVLLDDLLRGVPRHGEFALSLPHGVWNLDVRTVGKDPWTGTFRNESEAPTIVHYGSKNW